MKDSTRKTKPESERSDSNGGSKKPVEPKPREFKEYEDHNLTTWDIYSG